MVGGGWWWRWSSSAAFGFLTLFELWALGFGSEKGECILGGGVLHSGYLK